MLRKIMGALLVISLYGCATTTGDAAGPGARRTFPLEGGKKLSFKTSGCNIEGGALKNEGSYASAGSYGTLVAINTKSKAALDQYHVSCGAVPAGGTSSCVIQHVEGDGTFKGYGGLGCPDMNFTVTKFRSF